MAVANNGTMLLTVSVALYIFVRFSFGFSCTLNCVLQIIREKTFALSLLSIRFMWCSNVGKWKYRYTYASNEMHTFFRIWMIDNFLFMTWLLICLCVWELNSLPRGYWWICTYMSTKWTVCNIIYCHLSCCDQRCSQKIIFHICILKKSFT